MSWASHYIAKLQAGETVQFRPRGNSMSGRIESGSLCTLVPVNEENAAELEIGDAVLRRVGGIQYLHLVKASKGMRFQIGNNKGSINGWVGCKNIFGKCIKVEP